ncbi:hypothetical protein OAM64_04270 [Candidatus Thioglobus sp.]|nr:hypothetical protein [Candidatus Thioglobus sp.]
MGLNKRLIDQAGAAGGGLGDPTDNFDIVTYSGNGGTQSISLDFQADLIWTKNRTNDNPHMLSDSIRGFTKSISTNRNDAESSYFGTNQKIQNVTSSGYEVYTPSNGYGEINGTGYDYVAWCFKGGGAEVSNTDGGITTNVSANPDAGFSIIEYQGAGGGGSTGTGLSSPVELMIVKRYTSVQEVYLFQGSGTGTWNSFQMNSTAASTSRSVTVTNSTIQIPAAGDFNSDPNSRYIAYCFHSVDGYQKVGSYTGNGGTQSITLGFSPRFVMWKATNNVENFYMMDSVRGENNVLYADGNFAEGTSLGVSFTPTGFTLTGSFNASGINYLYLAIA